MIKEKDLPDGWKIKELRDVCLSKGEYGSGARAIEYDSKKPRYVRITDIDDNGCLKNKNKVSPSIIEEKCLLEDGDLLFARSGSVGKTYLYNKNDGFCQYAGYLIKFKPNSEIIDSNYLQYLTKTSYYWNWINSKQNAVTINNINAKKYAELKIPLPPLQTQKKIIVILEKAERLKEWRKEADELTDEFLKSTFLEMFGDPVTNPNEWNVKKLNDIILNIEAGWSVNGEQRRRKENEFAVLKISAVTSGFFIPDEHKVITNCENLKKIITPEKGDLLFSRANTHELVGATCIVRDNYPYLLLPDKLWKIKLDEQKNSSEYLKFILSHPAIRGEISKHATGSSGSMLNISMSKLKSIPIIVPPIELQNKFASIVQQVEQMREHQSQSKHHIDDLFNVLMQKAFKGELM
ncbi:MAG: restriction endonuclease subunit S [Methanosarcinaceae archaeon]|nr:restriction endonuclease subunit S [Methanosarcinaceae archaeon]